MTEKHLIIDTPHTFKSLTLIEDIVVRAAPSIKFMIGLTEDQVRDYCRKKRWRVHNAGVENVGNT